MIRPQLLAPEPPAESRFKATAPRLVRRRSISRRDFLSASARLALGATLGYGLLSSTGCGSTAGEGLGALAEQAWADLAARISGPVLRPGQPGYALAAAPNNLRYASTLPAGIAQCQNANDVSQSILWAREFNLPLITRSGGHSYAGYSTTTGLMIDVSGLNQAQFDPSSGVLTIAGGVRNGQLPGALQGSNVAITHGRCSTVGAAGFLLGGGIGFNMRAHGVGADNLLATQLVTADGQLVTASASQNPDLFWACRGGGGGNFGINTSFSLQTFPVGDLTAFSISWTSNPEEVYPALLAALYAGPPGLGTRVQLNAVTPQQLAAGQDVTIALIGQLTGTAEDLAEILQPVYQVAEPSSSKIQELSYWAAQAFLTEPGPPGFYQEESRFFIGQVSSQAIATAFQWLRQWPGTSKSADMVLFQTGDQVNAMAPDATAFVHRTSDWLMTIALNWDAQDSDAVVNQNLDWQSEFYGAMVPLAGGGAFQNFVDPTLVDWQQAYYGTNLERLEQIKAQVDPTRVFNFPEAIPPAS